MDAQATLTDGREQHTPLCEFGETVQHMLPTVKQFPKLEPRLYNGIWLGKDTSTGELDCVNTGPWKTPASALPTPTLATQLTMPATSKAPPSQKDATTSAAAEGKRQSSTKASGQQTKQKKTAEPTHQWLHHERIRSDQRCQPPTSRTRERDDTVAEGSAGKQQRITAERQALERPTTTE